MVTETLGSEVPVRLGFANIVMLSPLTPESLKDASAGVEGTAGGTVSTVKLNGVTVLAACGASSFPVRTCAPSLNGVLVLTQTFIHGSELNVPIETPSMNI